VLSCRRTDIGSQATWTEEVLRNYIGIKLVNLLDDRFNLHATLLLILLAQLIALFHHYELACTSGALHLSIECHQLRIVILFAVNAAVTLVLMAVIARLLYFLVESFTQEVHPGLQNELEVHIEVVNRRLCIKLVIFEISVAELQLLGILHLELLRFLLDHIQ